MYLCRRWLLNDLFVDPSQRKHGVGSLLLDKAAEFAKSTGASSLDLRTQPENKTAQSLYIQKGYVDDGFLHFTKSL